MESVLSLCDVCGILETHAGVSDISFFVWHYDEYLALPLLALPVYTMCHCGVKHGGQQALALHERVCLLLRPL